MSLNQSFISERCSLGKYPSTQSSFGDALVSSISVDTRGGGGAGVDGREVVRMNPTNHWRAFYLRKRLYTVNCQ